MPNILKVQPRPFESDNPECLEKELGDPFQVDGDGDPRYEVRERGESGREGRWGGEM